MAHVDRKARTICHWDSSFSAHRDGIVAERLRAWCSHLLEPLNCPPATFLAGVSTFLNDFLDFASFIRTRELTTAFFFSAGHSTTKRRNQLWRLCVCHCPFLTFLWESTKEHRSRGSIHETIVATHKAGSQQYRPRCGIRRDNR